MPIPRNLDLDLLRAFATVAETGSFTRAAERLLRTQSTVSLQIKRLEDALDRRVIARGPRGATVTPAGAILLGPARRLLALNDEIVSDAAEPPLAGTVRLGTPEDFATTHLPGVLARFAETHPGVTLEVTCDLTLNLQQRFRGGDFDLVLVKREPARRAPGIAVWREPLVWVAGERVALGGRETLPLVVSPEPCVYRKRATSALDRAGRTWRIAYTCGSLAGSLAAVMAGLGATVLPKEMVPPGLVAIAAGNGLPDLKDTEIALLSTMHLSPPAKRLRAHIVQSLERGA